MGVMVLQGWGIKIEDIIEAVESHAESGTL